MELKIEHLYKNYRKKEALKDINLDLKKGIYGLLGENGAGKSTLMRLLATTNFPSKGEIFYNSDNIFSLDEKYRSLIGYLPQEYSVYSGFTAKDFLEYIGVLKGIDKEALKRKIPEVLEFVNLSNEMNKKVKTFSGGMKRRVGIAQAIINNPQILILDEPTAGLDPAERIRFSNIISDMAKEKLVLLSTHIVSDIEAIANNLIIIKNGEIKETGEVSNLIEKVRGRVWEVRVDQMEFKKLRQMRNVLHIKQLGESVQVRFVGEIYPQTENISMEPTLEDYYADTGAGPTETLD